MPDKPITSDALFAAFPRGVILPWYVQSGTVPHGWAICDGSNGTPDLRQGFLMGVSDMADVGESGGVNEIDMPLVTSSVLPSSRRARADDLGPNNTRRFAQPLAHHHEVRAQFDNRPAYVTVLFIMKL